MRKAAFLANWYIGRVRDTGNTQRATTLPTVGIGYRRPIRVGSASRWYPARPSTSKLLSKPLTTPQPVVLRFTITPS
jgi:hypothetical protein